jgi:hypothetical protein
MTQTDTVLATINEPLPSTLSQKSTAFDARRAKKRCKQRKQLAQAAQKARLLAF